MARSRWAAAALDDLRRLARTPYLLGIAGLIIAGQTIGAFMYNEQGKYVAAAYALGRRPRGDVRDMEIAVNLLSLFFQAVVVTWLTRRGSVALSLSAMPVLLGASFIVLALFPVGGVLLVTQVIRRAADYGLGKPPREMLFTVLNPESKFKSKSLIDTVLQRGADSAAQWLYVLVAGIGLAGIAWLCAGCAWRCSARPRTLGRAFETRARRSRRRAGARHERRRRRAARAAPRRRRASRTSTCAPSSGSRRRSWPPTPCRRCSISPTCGSSGGCPPTRWRPWALSTGS